MNWYWHQNRQIPDKSYHSKSHSIVSHMQPNLQPLIFVVDDDFFYQKLIEQNLKSDGYTRLLCFTSGEECLNNLHLIPDIILLDYNLQDTNGIDVLKKIKVLNQQVYVFFLSAQEEIDIAVNSIKHGAFGYVVKDEWAFTNILEEIKGIVSYQAVAESKNRKYTNSPFVGLSSYITEREQKEQILIDKNKQLTKLNNELDNFVYSASHNLRGPLTSILGLIKIAQAESENFDKVVFLNRIENMATRLDDTVKDIVDYSINNRVEITCEKINFKEIIETTFEHLSYLDGASHIKKQVIIEQQQVCFSDTTRLRILLNNLICNAIQYQDFTKQDSFIHITVQIQQNKVILDITDNGIGIDKAYVGKVFDMFFRGTTISKGSGLGLYIVKEIINKLKGTLELTSKVNEGTHFCISLPAQGKHLMEKETLN